MCIRDSDHVVEHIFAPWRASYPDRDIRMVHGMWQDVTDQLDDYDGIFFHTFPMDEKEFVDNIVNSITFAEHFFPIAAQHLRPGGVFTYLTNEIDSFSRRHQRLVLEHFSSFTLAVQSVEIPDHAKDLWWAESMVIIKAVK